MSDQKRTRLTKLRWDEISGVDDPANETPGWAVMKAKDIAEDVADVEKAVTGAYDNLYADGFDAYIYGAPEDVRKARELLLEHMERDIEIVEEDAVPETEPVAKRGPLARLRDRLNGDETAPAPAETPAQKATEPPAPAGDAEREDELDVEALTKSVAATVSEDLAKQIGDVLADRFETELAPIREAVAATADRLESVEKSTATRMGAPGQELPTGGDEDPRQGLAKAIRFAGANPGTKLTAAE